MRTTINNVNAALLKHGYEIVRGPGYYYMTPLRDDVRQISEEGLYATRRLSQWTIEGIERELLERMDRFPDTMGGE